MLELLGVLIGVFLFGLFLLTEPGAEVVGWITTNPDRLGKGILTATFTVAYIGIIWKLATIGGAKWGSVIFLLGIIPTPLIVWKLWELWGELLE
jgi:hypothetical protein